MIERRHYHFEAGTALVQSGADRMPPHMRRELDAYLAHYRQQPFAAIYRCAACALRE